jgi:hypothetical protein
MVLYQICVFGVDLKYVQTLEYRYISKLPMKNERLWSYVKETTSHLQNKQVELSPLPNFGKQPYFFMHICR